MEPQPEVIPAICPIPPIPGIGQDNFFELGLAKIANLRVDSSD